jgi:hypothetical protein
MNSLYYTDNSGDVQGPVSKNDLEELHRSGQISATTKVCQEGSENWIPFYQFATANPTQPQENRKQKSTEPIQEARSNVKSSPSESDDQWLHKSHFIPLMILLLGFGFLFFQTMKRPQEWEYETMEILAASEAFSGSSGNLAKLDTRTIPDISARLKAMGLLEWELIDSFLENETAHPNFGAENLVTGLQPNVRPRKLVLIFKRPRKQ